MILGQRIKASESSWPPHPVLLLVKSERFWLRRVLDPFKDPLAAAINLSGYGVYTRGFSLGTYAKCSATIPGLDVGITSLLHFFSVILYVIGLAWGGGLFHRVPGREGACAFSSGTSLRSCLWLTTATPTQRRSSRRRRATARRAWFLHSRGFARLQPHHLGHLWKVLKHHHSKDPTFLRQIRQAMANTGQNGWYCATCRKMRSPQAYFCDLCGQAWEQCMGQPGAHRAQQRSAYGQATGWQEQQPQQRTKSPRTQNRPRSRKKRQDHFWSSKDQQSHTRADLGSNSWASSGQWMSPAPQTDSKGKGKGLQHFPMQMASLRRRRLC